MRNLDCLLKLRRTLLSGMINNILQKQIDCMRQLWFFLFVVNHDIVTDIRKNSNIYSNVM